MQTLTRIAQGTVARGLVHQRPLMQLSTPYLPYHQADGGRMAVG